MKEKPIEGYKYVDPDPVSDKKKKMPEKQWWDTLKPEKVIDLLPIMTFSKGQKTRISVPVHESTDVIATMIREKYPEKFKINLDVYKSMVYASFIASQGDLPIAQITSKHIHQYLSTRPTNNNYNMHRKDLSALFNWGIRILKLRITNPCLYLDKMPHRAKEKQIPTEKEILQIMAAAMPGDEKDIVTCCLHTLGRIDEILRIEWQRDVNFEKKAVTLWTRKRRDGSYEPDDMPMNKPLEEMLWRRWQDRVQDRWVFYNEDTGTRFKHRPKMMKAICKRAGIKPLDQEKDLYYGFHSLRHFMASLLQDKKKASTKVVSGLLRHKNVQTTEIYLHSIDESHRRAMDEIGEYFASKNEEPQAEAASREDTPSSNLL